MAKKDAKGVEMPKAEPQSNKPSYENLLQIANQLAQQNEFFKKRVSALESELGKFANNYQRIVFLQETLKIFNDSLKPVRGLFGKTKGHETHLFETDEQYNAAKSYVDELIQLLSENKEIPAKAKEILKPKAEGNEQSKEQQ